MIERFRIGIDLGGTNCRGALVDSTGRILASRRMKTRMDLGLENFLDRMLAFCRELGSSGASASIPVDALGIGVPGIISSDGVVRVSPNLPALDNAPLAKLLSERLELPVNLVNDANAIAWGEGLFGAGRQFSSFLVVTLGTGVGGGLLLDRQLWEGLDGMAGEVGHMMVEPAGRPCGCGSRGCLEQYASATGIVKTVRLAMEAGESSLLSSTPGGKLNSHRVGMAAREGDSVALAAMAEAGRRLGQVLGGIANLLNLDGVVVTGGASESFDLMEPEMTAELHRRAFAIVADRLRIVRGELGDNAGILGAAAIMDRG